MNQPALDESQSQPSFLDRWLLNVSSLLGVIVVGGGIYFFGFTENAWQRASLWIDRNWSSELGFPRCDSNLAKDDVHQTFENSPERRINGLSIVSWVSAREVSRSREEVRCRGRIRLNAGGDMDISYRFFDGRRDGSNFRYMVEYELED